MYFRLNMFITFLLINTTILAQSGKILFTIEDENIYLNEFEKAYKNSYNLNIKENKKTARSFLEQFINFKLKVTEAKKLFLDRDKSVRSKLQNFKELLVQPYLYDSQMLDYYARQAYERMKTEIHVRHILVKVSPFATPKDTIIAYQKALNIQMELVNGKSFRELAMQVSDDPYAAINGGDLGFIVPFKMPYKFENYIYSGSQKKYSAPIRTRWGYHIIQIMEKRNTSGAFKLEHIMIAHPNDTSKLAQQKVKDEADNIYKKLIKGENFRKLSLAYSDDRKDTIPMGPLPWFTTGDVLPEIKDVYIQLNVDAAFSKPLKTDYGWHVIKRIEKKELPPYELIKNQLEKEVLNNDRGGFAINDALKKVKEKYNFKDYGALSPIYDYVDSTIFEAKWKQPEFADLNSKIFEFGNQTYRQKDLVDYLENNQSEMFPIPIIHYVNIKYRQFIKEKLLVFETKQILRTSPEIALRAKEYKEELLASRVMENENVTKQVNNESELLSFYNKNKSSYNKNYQANVSIFKYSSDLKKVEKKFKKLKKQGASEQRLISEIKAGVDLGFELLEKVTREEGEDAIVDKVINQYKSGQLEKGDKLIILEKDKRLIWLNDEIKKTNKSLEEVKEQVINDYEKYAEQIWLQKLKRKYKVKINENVFESIFNN